MQWEPNAIINYGRKNIANGTALNKFWDLYKFIHAMKHNKQIHLFCFETQNDQICSKLICIHINNSTDFEVSDLDWQI